MKKIIHICNKLLAIFLNYLNRAQLFYIIEPANWSIKWDGYYILHYLKDRIKSRKTITPMCIKNAVIHYGSVNTLISNNGFLNNHDINRSILTWFHIDKNDKRIKYIPQLNSRVKIVHTPSHITKTELIKYGLDPAKIQVIPLGVDLKLFYAVNKKKKLGIRRILGIPDDKYIIGSFQKDGIGWKNGNRPKLEKGPDTFVKAVKALAEKQDVFVLLTGPARGYVIQKLKQYQIPYKYIYLRRYHDIVRYYQALDLYLITSRAEGGPKALLEAMACGIPLVSTNVGMAPDIILDGQNGFLTNVDHIEQIVKKSEILIKNKKLSEKFVRNGLKQIKKYDWPYLIQQYYHKLYEPLLNHI